VNNQSIISSGIVLAGGNSKRMGTNKLHLPWGSGTLLTNTLEILKTLKMDVYAVGNPKVHNLSENNNLQIIVDEGILGPLGGILAGLQASKQKYSFITAADLPFITVESICKLINLHKNTQLTVIKTDDGIHPLFGIYSKECIPSIQNSIDSFNYKVTSFWNQIQTQVVNVGSDPYWKHILFNVNNRANYKKALEIKKEIV